MTEAVREHVLKTLQRMGHVFNLQSRARVDSKLHYHLMADALYWTDEIPDGLDDPMHDALRIVLRYRTSLIAGRPDAQWAEYWEEAKRAFPDWLGFRKDRCRADMELRMLYEEFARQATATITEDKV